MRRVSIVIAVALGITSASTTAAEPRDMLATGKDLLTACSSPEPLAYGMCMGFISGLVDGFLVADRTTICIPSAVTRGQMRDVVMTGIQTSPTAPQQRSYEVALLALAKAYPCRGRRGGGVR